MLTREERTELGNQLVDLSVKYGRSGGCRVADLLKMLALVFYGGDEDALWEQIKSLRMDASLVLQAARTFKADRTKHREED